MKVAAGALNRTTAIATFRSSYINDLKIKTTISMTHDNPKNVMLNANAEVMYFVIKVESFLLWSIRAKYSLVLYYFRERPLE
jgi:hypothetical protein